MATDVVVDSSVIVALVTLEEYSEWASRNMREHEYFHILDLSFYEVANAIAHKVSDKLSVKDATMAFQKAEKMMALYSVHNFSEVTDDALNKAFELGITVYDAAFLSLAQRLDMRLLTLDRELAKKLKQTKYDRLINCPDKKPP